MCNPRQPGPEQFSPNGCLIKTPFNRLRRSIALVFLLVGVHSLSGAPIELSPRTIALPHETGMPLFVDADGDGQCDMFVMDLAAKKILNFHQRGGSFADSPDQSIPLPPQTGWAALCDVDVHPGLELLFSTATGLVYLRQDAGLFELNPRTLIATQQDFPDFDRPTFTLLSTNTAGTNGVNDSIPVMSGGKIVPYHRNVDYGWSPGPPMILDTNQTRWAVNGDFWRSRWEMGSKPDKSLIVNKVFSPNPSSKSDEEPETDAIRKIMADIANKDTGWNGRRTPGMSRVDVNGDGLEDVVLWQISGELDFRTDIYLFLRGANHTLPEHPTQVLHCSGIPIPANTDDDDPSPMHDLNGDGICEIVLFDLTTVFTSPSDLVETALSRGMEYSLKIRTLHRGAFSRKVDASVNVRMLFALDHLGTWPFFIQGDFNGDRRPDLVVRRSDREWTIHCSTPDDRWFLEQPTMTFHTTPHGAFQIKDLNGDGLSDIIWLDNDNPELTIFMAPPRRSPNH